MADKEKGKVWYKIMIDFDEEIKKFQPSLEVDYGRYFKVRRTGFGGKDEML